MSYGFVDKVTISVYAGKGGDGAVTFHREKFVAAGGPDGGDGGRGGDVILVVDDHMSTLMDFRYKRKFTAANGENGLNKRCSGKDGANVTIRVPRGTLVRDKATGSIMADMSTGEPFVAARGGRGGWGNQHFATPTRQVPRFAKPGMPGESHELILELKLLADVGLVGFPNVGKSTLLASVSRARPKIADYHFTTLSPNLGVVYVSGSEGRDPVEDFETINRELADYSPALASRPQIVAANKCDLLGDDREPIERLKKHVEELGYEFFELSAATTAGTKELMQRAAAMLSTLPPIAVYEPDYVPPAPDLGSPEDVEIEEDDGVWYVSGPWMDRLVSTVNFTDYESRMYFDKSLRDAGIYERMEALGIRDGDTISICGMTFEYKS